MGKFDSILNGNKEELKLAVDEAPKKYGWMNQRNSNGRGSIVAMAAKNTFQFPVFMSSSMPLEYATAATVLLEQLYVSFLQSTISAQPYVSEKSIKLGTTFEKFKSDTNKYLEFASMQFQQDACHNEFVFENGDRMIFDVVAVEDHVARQINESVNHAPLSEFEHYFQEASAEVEFNGNGTRNVTFSGGINTLTGIGDVILKARQIMDYKEDRAVKIDGMIADTSKKMMELEKLRKDLSSYDKAESDKIKKTELEIKKIEKEIQLTTQKLEAEIGKARKDLMAKAPELIDDTKMAKLNTMKPYMMKVQIIVKGEDGTSTPMEQVVGVKCHCRVIDAATLPDVASFPLKEMNKSARKAKWQAGELRYFKDFIFETKEKKQTAVDRLDPKRSWYRRLYELAHRKGDNFAARATSTDTGSGFAFLQKTSEYGIIPNATIVVTQNDVSNVKAVTGIDLLDGRTAAKFCDELFLIAFMVVDQDAESIKLLLPDQSNTFEVHSIASLNKQMAELDTAGAKTKQMFKLLG